MNHPKSKDAYAIADTFYYLSLQVGEASRRVDMAKHLVPSGRENICGTLACHAGWFAWAKDLPSSGYESGGDAMAGVLGFGSSGILLRWAINPKLWGNARGSAMFTDGSAFGCVSDRLTLGKIAKHWYKVADRLEELEKKNAEE